MASCLIQGHTDDSFYNPTFNQHTGYAIDGSYYLLGVLQPAHVKASWFTEFGTNAFRGNQAAFPTDAVALLSPVSLVILNQTKSVAHAEDLPLWMQFVLGDNNALTNNFNSSVQGFLPTSVCYADGVVSVTYTPDSGNQPYPNPFVTANILATSVTSNVLTVTVDPLSYAVTGSPLTPTQFAVGQKVVISATNESFLNNQTVVVTSANASSFTAAFTHADFTNPTDVGLVTQSLPFLPPFPSPYPNISVTSRMVVNINFAQDSVYLDVAV